jgi:DNA-binding CsgD family transcriptional regulator
MRPNVRVPGPGKGGLRPSRAIEQDTVGAIYDAALDASRWPEALGRVAELAGLREAFLAVLDLRTLSFPVWETVGFDPRTVADFFLRWATPERNLWLRAGATLAPIGSTVSMDRLVPRRLLERSDHYAELLVPWHIEQCLGAVLFKDAQSIGVYTAYRPAQKPALDEQNEATMDRFVPHLRRAVELHRRLAAADGLGRGALEALHQLRLGVVLLDGRGRVLFANHSACGVFSSADGLTHVAGRLAASAPDEHAALARLVAEVVCTGQRRGTEAGGALLLHRPSGKRPLSVLLTPLGDSHFRQGTRVPVAALFVSDPEQAGESPLRVLARLHGLTPKEAKVVELLVKGRGLPEVASTLGVGLSTARTHLYRAFDKVGVRRQAELVGLGLDGLGQIRVFPANRAG